MGVLVERQNLVSLLKICVRDLLDSALQDDERKVSTECIHLKNFLCLIENVLKHQIRPSGRLIPLTGLLPSMIPANADQNRLLWSVLESIPGSEQIAESVRHMPSIHSAAGRCRAWIRLALMQKHLGDHIAQLQCMSDVLEQMYCETAVMRNDERSLVSGLLVGVNVVDFNFCLKDEDLDGFDTTIKLEPYLRRDVVLQQNGESTDRNSSFAKRQTILDQKNYIEELNRHLNSTLEKLKADNIALAAKCRSIDTSEDLAQQLQEVKTINIKLFEKFQVATTEKNRLEPCIVELKKERDEALSAVNELKSKLLRVELEYKQDRDATEELTSLKHQVVILEGDLKIEREWRKQLQGANNDQAERVKDLVQKVDSLESQLKHFEMYRKRCDDLDKTLEEMGAKLCDVQMATEELKEKSTVNFSSWQDDKEAEVCSACARPFNMSRRRHHCRKCGQIFCNVCSEGCMPLVRGGKPVRVCNVCQQELLQLFSVNSIAVLSHKRLSLNAVSSCSSSADMKNHRNSANGAAGKR